ncbi:beta-xylosidase [Paenibacillus amylolyticus]|uniref:Beta-xylosidase n=2 Tax=Paenibacillus amylolyticus TaxID=1451 RepID=A0AAP5H2C7_PAEAM|nr:beta-xylosidase [Paenibacillus amylolyticus]
MTLRFKIDNVKNGMYKIKVRSVNEEHGNVQQEWINLNMGQDLSNSEIDYLKQIAVPHMRIYQIEVNDETLEFNTELSRNEIKSIRLIYQY